uniref:Uncharacterized protein n=1 Tax=Tanacetum cinerariifolium TaxID=118510 RepID=A0A6L2JAJ6_TANCI|nr:hypothetical protein [Tanacetum cinerariifolium]
MIMKTTTILSKRHNQDSFSWWCNYVRDMQDLATMNLKTQILHNALEQGCFYASYETEGDQSVLIDGHEVVPVNDEDALMTITAN